MIDQIDAGDLTTIRNLVDAAIDRRIHALAPEIARAVAGNMPPGGMHPLEISVVSPTASTSADVATVPVLYRCNSESVLLVGDTTGTATVDIWRARPGETAPSVSLFGGSLPSLSSGRLAWINPTTAWEPYIEANSVLFYYVTAVSGLTRLDIALNVRCLTG